MSEQWIITGVQIVGSANIFGQGRPPLLARHEEEVNTAIERINANASGVGAVIRVDGPTMQTVSINGDMCTSATTAISFGVPASVFAMLPGPRPRFLPLDFITE